MVLSCEPENYSRHFNATKVSVDFDEYIVLDNVNQELVVSPPLDEKPVVKLKGKTLIIEINGELHENTTYTFNFGSAIKDLHEGNKLLNYEYVFSTGDVLDSLSVRGTLTYAFDLKKPEEPMFVMLYGDLRDSVPLVEPPFYIGRSDEKGNFSINNLRPDVYKLFALKDANNNFLYDLPSEEIAFLDSSLIVSAEYFRSIFARNDSLAAAGQDTTATTAAGDTATHTALTAQTAQADSTASASDSTLADYKKYNAIYVDLDIFTEESAVQYLSDYSRKDRRRLDLIFSQPVTDSFRISALQPDKFPPDWYIMQMGLKRDSIALWIPDSLVYQKDTIITVAAYTLPDSLGNPYTRLDTLSFTFRSGSSKGSTKKSNNDSQGKFSVRASSKGGQQDLNKMLFLTGSTPLKSFDAEKMSFTTVVDSLEQPVPFLPGPDSLRIDRIKLLTEWSGGADYHLILYPGALTSIFGETNDTTDIRFKAREQEYYGKFIIDVQNVNGPVIVELYANDKLYLARSVSQSGPCEFAFLPPQTYKLKFIHDRNNNGKWDTGKYLLKRQPEKVEWFEKEVEIRSNWDQRETYTLF